MPIKCSVPKCRSGVKKESDISFFSFPIKNEHRLTAWITAINRPNWIPKKTSKVCSKHFNPHDFLDHSGRYRKLKNNAVPSIFLSNPACLLKIQDKQMTTNKENEDKESVNTNTIIYESTKIEISNTSNEVRKELYQTQISPRTSHISLVEDMDIDKSTSSNSLKTKKTKTTSYKKLMLRHKIRVLQQQICMKNKKINTLKLLVAELKKQVNSKKAVATKSLGHIDHSYHKSIY